MPNILPSIKTAKNLNLRDKETIKQATKFLKDFLIPESSILKKLNRQDAKVAIRTESFRGDSKQDAIPNNKRLNYYLGKSDNKFDKNFNSAFRGPQDILNGEDFDVKDCIFHISQPLEGKDAEHYKSLRHNLQEIDHPEAENLLKSLKLLDVVKGKHNGAASIEKREFIIKVKGRDALIKLDSKRNSKENPDNYYNLVLSKMSEKEIRNDKIYTLLNSSRTEDINQRIKNYASTKFETFKKKNPEYQSMSEERFKNFIIKDHNFDKCLKLIDEDLCNKPSIKKFIDEKPLNEVLEVQIKNPNFKNTLLERLSRDKEVKIKMSYNESMDIPEEKKCELIIRSGLMHKDVVLFSEEGISVENIRNLQKGLKDQQKENVTRASEIGLLNGFSLKEVDALKNAPVRVLLYKDNKYVEHPLDKKLNPNLPSNTSSLPNIGSNTR